MVAPSSLLSTATFPTNAASQRAKNRDRFSAGQLKRRPHLLEDFEAAKPYFHKGRVQTYPSGRICWSKSTLFATMFAEQGEACHWCRKPMNKSDFQGPDYPSFEHIIALKDNGRDHVSNLKLAHLDCNKKRDRNMLRGTILSRCIKSQDIQWT